MIKENDLKKWVREVQDVKPMPDRVDVMDLWHSDRSENIASTQLSMTKAKTSLSVIEPLVEKKLETSKKSLSVVTIDPQWQKKLQKGQLNLQNRLDLHGLSLQRAFYTTISFIQDNFYQNIRRLLIITGKTAYQNRPSLYSELPTWLEHSEIAFLVRWHCFAAPRHGGEGARYVILRRS